MITRKQLYVLIGLVFVLNLGVGSYFAFKPKLQPVKPAPPPHVYDKTRSRFSAKPVDGWWQGATNHTSMVLFKNSKECFVSAQFKKGALDQTKELADMTAGGIQSTPGAAEKATLTTVPNGPQTYTLQHYTLNGSADGQTVMHGIAIGFLEVKEGYIKMDAHCDESAQMPAALAAVNAIQYDPWK